MLPLLLAASVVLAAQDPSTPPPEGPRFTSQHAELVDLSDRLWEAGIRCTGWEPVTKGPVAITLTSSVKVGHGEALLELAKGATADRFPVLTEIRLVPDTTVGVLAHELAHAWAGFGTVALVEGKAELLSRCMLAGIGRARPDQLRGRLGAVPDLRAGEWRVDPYAYLAAARLVRVLDLVLPPEVLWQQRGPLMWEMVDDSLEEAGTAGALVMAALHGGRKTLRKALKDANGNGRVTLEDQLLPPEEPTTVARGRLARSQQGGRAASHNRWAVSRGLVP